MELDVLNKTFDMALNGSEIGLIINASDYQLKEEITEHLTIRIIDNSPDQGE